MPPARQGLSEEEREEVTKLSPPRAPVLYEVVRHEGEAELQRPMGSLFWSGLAGGITIMASVIGQGALEMKLPGSLPWRQPVADIGYSLGFLMVILGRMQLFTEQTIVTVLPIVAAPSWRKLAVAARLWTIVFLANLLGTAIAAAMNIYLHLMGEKLLASMLQVSGHLLEKPPAALLAQAVPAGFLIASVAWIRAGVTGGDFWIVLTLTTAIALGDFTHVVAGAAETFLLLFSGHVGAGRAIGGIIAPALAGNVIGGTLLFALLAHAQVRQEL
jgi:formate/nitrite transporter FocA (FNT family)